MLAAKYESSEKLMELIQHAESDAWLSLGLSFYLNFLPLTLQLSQLSGSLWSKALQVNLPEVRGHVRMLVADVTLEA